MEYENSCPMYVYAIILFISIVFFLSKLCFISLERMHLEKMELYELLGTKPLPVLIGKCLNR